MLNITGEFSKKINSTGFFFAKSELKAVVDSTLREPGVSLTFISIQMSSYLMNF